MTTGIAQRFQLLWTAHTGRPGSPAEYGFGPGGYATAWGDDITEGVRRLIGARASVSTIWPGQPDAARVLPAVERLYQEVLPLVGNVQAPHTEAGSVAFYVWHHLVRYMPAPGEPFEQAKHGSLFWNCESFYEATGEKLDQTESIAIAQIGSLSPTSRQVVRILDGYARDATIRAYVRAVESVSGGNSVPGAPPPAKARAFIGYRRSQLGTALRLHDRLSRYGGGVFFEPFLDRHDMRAGEWLEQLRRSIEDADLFLALCSSDYAEAGTVSAWELEHAEEILGSNRIAPIRLGSVRPKVWDRLSRLHALDVEDPLNDTSDELEQFLRSCLGSLTAGLSAGCEP